MEKRAQVAPEAVLIAGVMMFLLLAMFAVSEHMRQQWDAERQSLQASSAANALAQQINLVAAGGNGTSVQYFNSAGGDITNMSIYNLRSLRAYYREGGFVSVALVTNNTNMSSPTIPLNVELWLNNTNGTVYIAGA